MNIKLWLITAVVPGMMSGMGQETTSHLIRATGRTTAVLDFIRKHPLAHDILNPKEAK